MPYNTSPAIIFLPGASGNTEFWQPIKQYFQTLYRTHIISYPGFGGYAQQADIRSMADLQQHVLEQIQQPSIVVAQSMGGIFAMQAALQKPELIHALILVATSGGIDLSPFQVKDWRAQYQQQFQVPDWFIEDHTHLDSRLPEVRCPVLLLWGDADPISPVAVGQYLQHQLAHAQLHIVPDGEHDLALVYAEQCQKLIQNFLQSLLPAD